MKPTAAQREYRRSECVVFRKTHDRFGGLSNMAAGFPLNVNGIDIATSEALYQACRFPYRSDIQREIIAQRSPMTAKMKSKKYRREHTRNDWNRVLVNIMRWSLRVKLSQNWNTFSRLLLDTENRPIVEESMRDTFWGAKPKTDTILEGANILGRLLVELREEVRTHGNQQFVIVDPPAKIPDFLLFDKLVVAVQCEPTHRNLDIPLFPQAASSEQ